MSSPASPPSIDIRDTSGRLMALMPDIFREQREVLVDRAIVVAKDFGYAQYTTTIRAAWIEAIDSVTDSLSDYLIEHAANDALPNGDIDYQRDRRFLLMRNVAKRHRSIGITLQLYLGLFKHFKVLYRDVFDQACDDGKITCDCEIVSAARNRLLGFFDAAELSIAADWAEATEDDRLMELQARARSVTLEKDRYFSVFESLRDPAFLLDRQRRLLNANQAAAELFVGRADAGEIIYLKSKRGRKASLADVLAKAAEAKSSSDDAIWLETRDGPMCFDLRERAIHDALENTRLGYIVILHDVTTHRLATEDAERARGAMSTFLATMSHEIRTPLHGVLGAAELLRDADRAHHDAYLDAIETAGRHLLQTLNKVLDYSRFETRPPDPTATPCDLKTLLADYSRFASVWAEQSGVPFSMSIARNLPTSIMLDWDMTQQVLTNLVANAIRHDAGGGVTLSVRRRSVSTASPRLRFEVQDHGSGVPAAIADNLFEPFGARAPGRKDGSGAGLGLAICHRLVAALGGDIGFRNRRTGGALFWFDLPYGRIRKPDQRRASSSSAIQEQELSPEQEGQCCLLVDDDEVSRMISADQIRRSGFEVVEVDSADAARTMAATMTFDAFVIDYHLPDGDGASLALELRQRPIQSDARYVALTANADLVISANGGPDPFDRLLAKPASGETLVAALKKNDDSPEVSTQPANGGQLPLVGISPRIIDAVAAAFTAQWDNEVEKLDVAMANGDRRRLADIAHKIASSCATIGITDLADMLKELEVECRRREHELNLQAWQTRLAPALLAAPDQVRALASEQVP
ncbi:MAG: ATP-binding protein [Geminicoccaceae bacterium]